MQTNFCRPTRDLSVCFFSLLLDLKGEHGEEIYACFREGYFYIVILVNYHLVLVSKGHTVFIQQRT